MSNAVPLEIPRATAPAVLDRVRQRAKRHALWMRHLWAQGVTSADQGLAITHGEVDRLLADPENLAADAEDFYDADPAARKLRDAIVRADAAVEHDRE